jgi:5-methylcytosine-specific restriction endonuclease McrA
MTYQTCIRCHDCKPLERFHVIKRSGKHDTRCRDCIAKMMRARYKEDPASMRQSGERYRSKRKSEGRPVGAYRHKTKAQKLRAAQYVKEWRARNGEQFSNEARQSVQMRRSLAYLKAWPVIVEHYGNKCLGCGATASALCFDHVVPISQGGANLLTNGQPLCRACNAFKGQTGTGSQDHRQDGGAWIADLARLNPWLVEPMPSGRWHLTVEGKHRLAWLKEQAGQPLVMPGHITQGEGAKEGENEKEGEGSVGSVPVAAQAPQSPRQIAQSRLLASLLANLPRD